MSLWMIAGQNPNKLLRCSVMSSAKSNAYGLFRDSICDDHEGLLIHVY